MINDGVSEYDAIRLYIVWDGKRLYGVMLFYLQTTRTFFISPLINSKKQCYNLGATCNYDRLNEVQPLPDLTL